jgi:hypothetical protein
MKNSQILKHITFALLLFTFVFSFGCAKTVTNVNFGSTMTVTVTLRDNADVTKNRYFMVLGSNSTFSTPRPPAQDGGDYEFLEPDITPFTTNHPTAEYFAKFFNTWDGYIVLDSTQNFSLVHGPFVEGAIVNRTPLTPAFTGGKTLSFNFQLNQIYTSVAGVPANAYFNVIAVAWPPQGTAARIAWDDLTTNTYISTISGSTQTVNNTFTALVDASLDIQSVVVTVQ